MRSLQDYRSIYKEIASNLGLQGDSVELLVQLLSQASYISEVENASYIQESSLERATLMNSKIQKCMDEMYSVYRGSCPRVIMKFKTTKYFSWNVFDEIVASNNFKIYYLGYYGVSSEDELDYVSRVAIEEGFVYAPVTIPPDTEITIIGLLAPDYIEQEWTLTTNNTYYVDCLEESLSNDMCVKVNDSYYKSTRNFSDHIIEGSVFDLTLPSFGSRLYVADIFKSGGIGETETETPANTKIYAKYYKFSTRSSYNDSELKRISIKGTELEAFDSVWLIERGYEELSSGIIVLSEGSRDTVTNVHYRASRDRFVNSILRSNSDIGRILEEMYPRKVKSGGTAYKFVASEDGSSNILKLCYVPLDDLNLLSTAEIQEFVDTRLAYYVTDTITVQKGIKYTAIFNIDLELYTQTDVTADIKEIIDVYTGVFGMSFADKEAEIRTLISKISAVKEIKSFNIMYASEDGTILEDEDCSWNTYYVTQYIINTTIQTKA